MRDRDLICEGARVDHRRYWCAYTDLEEFAAGMWRPIHGDRAQTKLVALSVSLLRSPARFDDAVRLVLSSWPTSCRAEFTSPGNHLAWLGCAACCLVDGVPEDLTRRAWWKLTEHERATANLVASTAVARWARDNGAVQLGLW
ncbi:MAG: hypothetical protein GY851_09320 [bacterium]|nr:hypothetical protein [bacterium]